MRRFTPLLTAALVLTILATFTRAADMRVLDFAVVDAATGKPMPAELNVRWDGSDAENKPVVGADGKARVEYPAAATFLSVAAEAPGYVPAQAAWHRESSDGAASSVPAEFTLKLEKGTTVGGVVRDEKGQPIEGATVSLIIQKRSADAGPVRAGIWDRPFKTDKDGRWTCDVAPPGVDDVLIRLSHPEYVSDNQFNATEPRPTPQQLRDLTAVSVMKKGFEVKGRVTDAAGKPVADAQVKQGRDRWGSHYPQTKTDADGAFRFPHSTTGEMILTVQSDGYAPELARVKAAPGVAPVEIKLAPGKTLRGRVVDPEGKPLAGAMVVADSWRGFRSVEFRADTDAEGRFKWDNAPHDVVMFDILKQGFADLRQQALSAASDEEVVVKLRGPTVVRGSVVDAETGQPVPEFRVVQGIHFGEGRPIYWERRDDNRTPPGKDGRFELTISFPRPGHAVRIEADGYEPADSRVFKDDEPQPVVLEIKLRKGRGVAGTVLTPDGKPAAGAEVALGTPSNGLFVENGRVADQSRRDTLVVKTGADGRFSIPPQSDPFILVVAHDAGYAEVKKEDLAASHDVKLSPWAKIEGTAKIGARPAAGEAVNAWDAGGQYDSKGPNVNRSLKATADEQGRFVIGRVSPGKWAVGRYVRFGESGATTSHAVRLTAEAGKAHELMIGGTGRPVVGRVQVPDEVKAVSGWQWGFDHLMSKVDAPMFEWPDEVKEMEPEEKQKWYENWKKSDEGKAFMAAQEQAYAGMRHMAVLVDPNGYFRVDDVPAGTYTLTLSAFAPPPANQCGFGDQLGSVTHEFTVPEMPGGRGDEPLELPTLALKAKATVKVGDAAPAFSTKTVDGKDISLADYKGKYVLLDFWATWCGPCVAETPNLKETFDAFGANERFVMVALSLDEKAAAPQKYAQKRDLKWVQGFLGEWSKTDVPASYGVNGIPSIWLIGPDGKVIAKDLRGAAIKAAVAQALSQSPEKATGNP